MPSAISRIDGAAAASSAISAFNDPGWGRPIASVAAWNPSWVSPETKSWLIDRQAARAVSSLDAIAGAYRRRSTSVHH